MKQRCADKNCAAYKNYGGRGIKVCDRWLESFENFVEDMGEKPFEYTLDRVDVNGGYSPDNCRWASRKTQMENKRKNIRYKECLYQSLAKLAEAYSINYSTFYWRLSNGWSLEESLEKPILYDIRRI